MLNDTHVFLVFFLSMLLFRLHSPFIIHSIKIVAFLLIYVFFFIWSLSEHKLVMVGLDNAGKTTILYQFLMNEVVHTSPTIGSNVEEIVWKNIHFLVWDLAGKSFSFVYTHICIEM